MKYAFAFALLLSSVALSQSLPNDSRVPQIEPKAATIPQEYGRLPLSFEPNRGQTSSQVQWVARGPLYALFLTGNDAVLELNSTTPPKIGEAPRIRSSAIRMTMLGSQAAEQTAAEEPLAGKANYFQSNNRAKWNVDVPTFGRVRLRGVYPGIDLVYYGRQGQLEYDFVVAPGANAAKIQLGFSGATPRLAVNGDLSLPVEGTATEVRFDKPVAYQTIDGQRRPVAGAFSIAEDHRVTFALDAYDHSHELVIDPTLIFDGTLGTGNQQTIPTAMTVDAAGEMVLTGYTNDLTFPVTTGALQTNCQTYSPAAAASGFVRCGPSSTTSAFVTKLSADGTSLVYSTYLHGGGGAESGQAVAVDAAGDAYVLGATSSNDFPITSDAYQTFCQPTYPLLSFYPTAVYGPLTSECDNFYNGGGTEYTVNGPSLFISKLNPAGSALLYSTFFGGGGAVYPVGLALDSANNIVFAAEQGPARSDGQLYPQGDRGEAQYPLTSSAYLAHGYDISEPAISKLSADGHTLLYSTLFGSTSSDGNNTVYTTGFALGPNGIAYLGGYTYGAQFPTTAGSIKPACTLNPNNPASCSNAQGFVAAIDTTQSGVASLLYSTYLGGNAGQGSNIPEQQVYGLRADSGNNLYVTGYTYAIDFPSTPGTFQTSCTSQSGAQSCNQSAFLTKINPSGSAIAWSTFLRGTTGTSAGTTGNAIALDRLGRVYVLGQSQDGGGDFPQVNPLQGYAGGDKVSISTFSSDASQLLFSTRFGNGTPGIGSNEEPIGNGIALDTTGNIYFAGYTNAGGNFATTPGTFATTATNGFNRAFFGKISAITPPSATTLSIVPAVQSLGQSVVFSVSVVGGTQTTPVPTGIVTLNLSNATSTSVLGTVTLDATGAGTFATSTLALGSYTLTAAYGGDTHYDVSVSPPEPLTITQGVTGTTLAVSAASLNPGQPETLTATVAGGSSPALSGTVIFSDQNGAIGSSALTPTATGGIAALTLTTLSSGSHQIVARYSGDTNYLASASTAQTVIVTQPTMTTLRPSAAAVNVNQPETLTATIGGGTSPLVTGTVTFFDGTASVGSAGVTANMASITLTALSAGTHSFTARYGGDTNYQGSLSGAQAVVVSQIAQTIAFPAIPDHSLGDTPFALGATASSGLTVTYVVVSGPATISGSTVTLTGTGAVAVQATQSGNATYAAATPVLQGFTVFPSTPTLAGILPVGTVVGSGATTITLTGTNFSATDTVQVNGSGVSTTLVNATMLTAIIPATLLGAAGTLQITVFDSADQKQSAAQIFTITSTPAVTFTGPATSQPAQQPTLSFTLVNPYPAALAATLTLTFAPASSTLTDDPNVQFSSGGRTLTFTIPANSTVTPAIQLQSGTVAGTVRVVLALTSSGVNVTPANVAPVVITIPPVAPVISTTSVTRNGNAMTVSVHAFSNTREVTTAVFHFTGAAGATIDTPDITANVSAAFSTWFASTPSAQFGSSFTYSQVFNLSNSSNTIQSVTVTLVNSVGSSAAGSAQ